MNSRKSFYLLTLAPVLLAFFIWDFDFETNLTTTSNNIGINSSTNTPDSILVNPYVNQYNLEGQLEQTLQGTELYSFDEGKVLQIESPEFLLSDISGENWDASASRGYLLQGQSIFQLEENVEMLKQSETFPINFSTSSLEIDLNRHIIQTDAGILIKAPNNNLSGTGFQANLQTNEFKILNGVKSIHEAL